MSGAPLLRLEGVSRHFGGLRALQEVSLEVPEGGIFALIGPNGSGKTTLFNVVTGLLAPSAGRIVFGGRDIGGARSHEIVRLGIGRTFQTIRLFTRMSVFHNVWVATRGNGPGGGDRARVAELLALAGLAPKSDELVERLTFAEQRRLELARALAGRPRLLLLDEPAAGMSALELEALAADIRGLRDRGTTVFLIEHTMHLVMGVAERIAVLNFGAKIAEGTPAEVRADPRVVEAYLGSAAAGA